MGVRAHLDVINTGSETLKGLDDSVFILSFPPIEILS